MLVNPFLPEAALIDLDDTILDDSGAAEACWAEACASVPLPGVSAADLLAAIHRHRAWYWSDPDRHRQGRLALRRATAIIVELAMRELGCDRGDAAIQIANRYRDLREERACLFPGALQALERLRSSGVRLALVTNGAADGQRAKIERFGVGPYFDHIQIEGEFGLGKPYRQVYEAALRALRAEPAKTWSAGDNLEWDVGAPQRLGIYGIWLDREGRGLPPQSPVKPDRVIRRLADLLP